MSDEENLEEGGEGEAEEISLPELEELPETDAAQGQGAEEEEEKSWFGANRRKRAPVGMHRDATNLWLISYSDFMTILFIFFLVMYGYAVLEKQQRMSQGATISYDAFAKLMDRFEGVVGSANVEITTDSNKTTVQMKDSVLFASGSSELTPNAKTTLAELSKSLKLVAGDVIVEGHTDNVPIFGGRYKSNWELSAARAFSVIEELTANGVPAKRLAAWGFGENRPISSNVEETGRRNNRRIEVIIFNDRTHNT